ncbi:LysM peptidoglycan-binding domain-containing protein [Jiulongibacter sediminis]|jgi:membrane-bound lytic murein transglycosylase D|uniref:LysM peptidoglycan-binding domain-containing protein n=1 Tax=Jiulongibacter sediminis TaxID=1605367 RepID=UPI0026F02E2B|nr:LysM peptidoglycan-binding domain-containing protein [Jiulongibacter sediminis]
MPKLSFSKLLILPFLFVSAGLKAQNSDNNIKEVEALVIGKNPQRVVTVQKADSLADDSQKTAVSKVVKKQPIQKDSAVIFPGSIEVTDIRDNVKFHIIPASDEVIEQRIRGLENQMPMPYNEHVKKYVDYFLYKRPNFVKQMLERKEFYFPVFEKYLAKHNIPDEMKYLALLESGLNPNAVSRAKAVGMWQFMSYTGKEYGLKINDYMDERRHVEKSTDASFRYLTKLYSWFDDWELALASYNTGPGRIRRAIRKSGKTDYWALHNYIHPDTRAYVPQWEALNYLMNYSAEHGIYPDYAKTLYPMETENLLLDGPLNLVTFAQLNYLDFETLQLLNPHLLKHELPGYAKNVEIKVPTVNYVYFENNRECVLDSACVLSTPSTDVIALEDEKGHYHFEYKDIKHYHSVRSGDYLGKIAERYGVGLSDLKRWNGLRSNTIMKGQRLAYYKRESIKVYDAYHETKKETVVAKAEPKNTKPATETRSNVKITGEKNTALASTSSAPAERPFHYEKKTVVRYHSIRNGENLTTIARKYGTSVKDLMKLNNIASANKIMRGQRLKYETTDSEKVYDKVASEEDGNTFIVYTVQSGDTLWNISQRHGLTISEIKKINGMTSNSIHVGQKIKLKG